jgi:hypothetical protein
MNLKTKNNSIWMLLVLVTATAHAKVGFNLRGYYPLSSYEIKGKKIELTLSDKQKILLCENDPATLTKNKAILEKILSTNKQIEITANEAQDCVDDIQVLPPNSELVAEIDKEITKALGGIEIHVSDFEKNTQNHESFPHVRSLRAYSYVVVVPYGKAIVRDFTMNWTREPKTPLKYQVNEIQIIENKADEMGHQEYSQGSDAWEKLPFATSKPDMQTIELIRKIDQSKKFNLFKDLSDSAQVIIFDKQKNYLVKRIERGTCSQDRTIKIFSVDKKTYEVLGQLKTDYLDGGECPD